MARRLPVTPRADLPDGELVLTGRVMPASNATFVGTIGKIAVVYKPVAGERPLWDFPDVVLAQREVAAYALSEAFGWDIVPLTWLQEGPMGIGMVQLWAESDPTQSAVTLVATHETTDERWCRVFDGNDEQNRPVTLIHEDSLALRRMALFDIIANNADRKGGHVLEMAGGHRHGIDHGLTFHTAHKLRTVLWGWLGQELHVDEFEQVDRVRTQLKAELGEYLATLLTPPEISAVITRCEKLMQEARFPAPQDGMPAIPWPPF